MSTKDKLLLTLNDRAKIAELRQSLHCHPELSGHEENTASLIKEFLQHSHPTSIIEQLGGCGLAAIYRFGDAGPTILLRCELDALPIDEKHLSLPYRSSRPGVSHKCGHDGHMAILAGLASHLHQSSYHRGKVILLFQPSEETGAGAASILNDPKFRTIEPDYVFALHNLPGFEKSKILYREGIFTAAVCSMIIKLKGIASHASEPEKGNNPSSILAQIALLAEQLTNNCPDRDDFQLITPVYYRLGQIAYGMSAGDAEMHFTLRNWTSHSLRELIKLFISKISELTQRNQIDFTYTLLENFASTENDLAAVNIIVNAADQSHLPREQLRSPFKFGEDFGLFTQQFRGALFGIGAGIHHPPLHHRDYDFPDDIIETGITIFKNIIGIILNADRTDPGDI